LDEKDQEETKADDNKAKKKNEKNSQKSDSKS
jgi:hypothetical protein